MCSGPSLTAGHYSVSVSSCWLPLPANGPTDFCGGPRKTLAPDLQCWKLVTARPWATSTSRFRATRDQTLWSGFHLPAALFWRHSRRSRRRSKRPCSQSASSRVGSRAHPPLLEPRRKIHRTTAAAAAEALRSQQLVPWGLAGSPLPLSRSSALAHCSAPHVPFAPHARGPYVPPADPAGRLRQRGVRWTAPPMRRPRRRCRRHRWARACAPLWVCRVRLLAPTTGGLRGSAGEQSRLPRARPALAIWAYGPWLWYRLWRGGFYLISGKRSSVYPLSWSEGGREA